jgi:cell division protein FtsW
MRLKKRSPDFVIFLVTILLLSIGLIMVFSSSAIRAGVEQNDSFYFLKRQLIWALIGLAGMFSVMNVDYWHYKKWANVLLVINLILLVLVLIPGIGTEIRGSRRWLGIGSLSFTPSEMMKISLIIFMAKSLSLNQDNLKHFVRGVVPHLGILLLIAGLIMLQPDLGTTVAISGTVFLMLVAGGVRAIHLWGMALAGIGVVSAAIAIAPYRMQRVVAFLDPWKYASTWGFQTIQSLYAIGSGGLFGMGLGRSRQKFFYLPEQHTDFIFAILGEELGFIGAALIVLLFLLFVWRGLKIAMTTPDAFGSLLAVGITGGITFQAIINMGVVTGSLPVTGIALPFISSGGSSLLFTFIGVGILLNLSRYTATR